MCLEMEAIHNAKPTLKFKEGANDGYYYLQVDSMVAYDKVTKRQKMIGFTPKKTPWPGVIPLDSFGTIRRGVTLYMGPDSAGQNALWIDVMGRLSGTTPGPRVPSAYPNTASIALESAAGLWCVTIQKYYQGRRQIGRASCRERV